MPTILLVDDDADVANVISDMLTTRGYRVLTETEPGEAIRLVDAGRDPIDLLVTDIVMRGMHGHELAESLRDRWPRMKVLFMTGYPAEELRNHRVPLFGARVLTKPLAVDTVVDAVRGILGA